MRRALVVFAVAAVVSLTSCMAPLPYNPPHVDPYPYSFTDSSKTTYPKGLGGAQRFVSDSRERWTPCRNVGVQYPQDSARVLSGDCDDFAVMLAYYLQEYFGYDTLIVLNDYGGGHACAFVLASSGVSDISGCPVVPTVVHSGATYYPLDWRPCAEWTWLDPGSPISCVFEWYDLAGNATMVLNSSPSAR